MDILAVAHAPLAHHSGDRGDDMRITQIDLGQVEERFFCLSIGAQLRFLRVEHRHLTSLCLQVCLVAGQGRGKTLRFGVRLLDPLPGAKGRREQSTLPCRLEPGALDVGLCRLNRVFRFGDLRMLRRLSRFEVFDGGLSAEKICFGLRHSGPIIIVLDLDQHLTLFDALKIVDRDTTHIALDMRTQRRDVAAHIGVIRHLPNRQANPAVPLSSEQGDDNPGDD